MRATRPMSPTIFDRSFVCCENTEHLSHVQVKTRCRKETKCSSNDLYRNQGTKSFKTVSSFARRGDYASTLCKRRCCTPQVRDHSSQPHFDSIIWARASPARALLCMRSSAVVLQSAIRMFVARQSFVRSLRVIRRVQRAARQFLIKRKFAEMQAKATTIQSMVRCRQTRQICNEARVRCYPERCADDACEISREGCCLRRDDSSAGFTARFVINMIRRKYAAAVRIQTWMRSVQQRRV